jgi:acetyl esterase/lipase
MKLGTKRLCVTIISLSFSLLILAQEKVKIWKGTEVHAPSVTLEIYLPEQSVAQSTAVIVCPGGSYCWHDYTTEGTDVARWLQRNGIAAFVLNYRVQGKFQYASHSRALFGGHRHPDMIRDFQRAIQYVRENAEKYKVNPTKVGAMGFSAGGHLVMSGAEFFHTNFLQPKGIVPTVSLRPDFVAPIYPVVTMSEKVTHKRSRRALLGEYRKFSRQLRDSLSLEKHVPNDCPPVFLVNCKDDPVVKYQNSELLDSALTAKNIPHKYIQYKTGGHGFGASITKGSEECRAWKSEFIKWINQW